MKTKALLGIVLCCLALAGCAPLLLETEVAPLPLEFVVQDEAPLPWVVVEESVPTTFQQPGPVAPPLADPCIGVPMPNPPQVQPRPHAEERHGPDVWRVRRETGNPNDCPGNYRTYICHKSANPEDFLSPGREAWLFICEGQDSASVTWAHDNGTGSLLEGSSYTVSLNRLVNILISNFCQEIFLR